jgi:hypothetical protein
MSYFLPSVFAWAWLMAMPKGSRQRAMLSLERDSAA